LHRGSPDGPLLGSTTVEVNGDWTSFYEKTISFEKSSGRDSLFFVFKNAKNQGGLMNIDSLHLQ
jgi:cytochrome c